MTTHDNVPPFQAGAFVQRIARPESDVYRIDLVSYAPSSGFYLYDVTAVTGEDAGQKYPLTAISPTEYSTVTDPVTWPKLTPQQRQILNAAELLLHYLYRNVPETTVHYMVETLRKDLKHLTVPVEPQSVWSRAFVSNIRTRDYAKENHS